MQMRGFVGSLPNPLVGTLLRIAQPEAWPEVFVVCSGTFRLERAMLSLHPGMKVHSNDVSLFSTALAEHALGRQLDFQFKGELAFIEDLKLESYSARVAALLVASNMSGYATGKPNAFKVAHLAHYRNNFRHYVEATTEKVEKISEELPISSFTGGDWLDHVEEAIARGAGIIGYPPTFKGGYEKLFAFLHNNVAWTPPSYQVFDPKTLPDVLNRIAKSGVPYFIFGDQLVEGHEPVAEYRPKGKLTIYGYASGRDTGYLEAGSVGEPFTYDPIDVSKLTAETKCVLVRASGRQLNFLRQSYLKKSILFSQGDAHALVYLDNMLAGAIVYKVPNAVGAPLELISDFSITREGRIAKLIAAIATSRAAVRFIERQHIYRWDRLRTMAYSDNPVAMKYRGNWELMKRVEDNRQGAKFVLTYESKVRDDSPQDLFGQWWKRDGAKQVGSAARRDATGGLPEAPAPGG